MKGGISQFRYNQLNFLSKLYYNFMCLFDKKYCLDTTKGNYNANRPKKRHTLKNMSLNIDPANGKYNANRPPNERDASINKLFKMENSNTKNVPVRTAHNVPIRTKRCKD